MRTPRLIVLVVCTGLLGCHAHLFEQAKPDAAQVQWQGQVRDLLNEYDQRLRVLEERTAPPGVPDQT